MDLLVRILVAAGAATVLGAEGLGAIGALGRFAVAALWAAFATAVVWRLSRGIALPRPAGWIEWFAWTAVAAILGIAAFTALASPPNSVDAFGYHLSRVVWWAQRGSVAFFPTHYYPQVSMPPMAEYAMLPGWILAGGDRFANLVQWTGFAGSVAAAALVAREMGAGKRGQALAALFAATLPNGILQASGTKNECVLALWLTAAGCFALRWAAAPSRRNALWFGVAAGLALATKATAWLFLPPLAICVAAPAAVWQRRQAAQSLLVVAACVLALNGPHWWRNAAAFGSPLGPALAQESQSPAFRWTNAEPGFRATVSNAVRHISGQLGGRSERLNRAVYDAALAVHHAIGADPNDPASTWPGTVFAPPRNANHEADAPNRVHLLLLAACIPVVILRRGRLLGWLAALAVGFVLLCAALKYQPYFARVFLPLFVAAAPAFGVCAERLRVRDLAAGSRRVRNSLSRRWGSLVGQRRKHTLHPPGAPRPSGADWQGYPLGPADWQSAQPARFHHLRWRQPPPLRQDGSRPNPRVFITFGGGSRHMLRRLGPSILTAALCLLLLDQTRHPLLHNWTRPLSGPGSVLRTPRDSNYFRDMAQFGVEEAEYRRAAELAAAGGCRRIGIDNDRFHLEYPLQAFLLRIDPAVRFTHTAVRNATARYARAEPEPCAVVCLGCRGDAVKMAEYERFGTAETAGPLLVYRRGGRSSADTAAPAAAMSASFK